MIRSDNVVGHKDILEYMDKAVESGQVSHAYILQGEKGSGKKLLARTFAMALQCTGEGARPCGECHSCRQAASGNHPDIVWVKHEKPSLIRVDDIRDQVIRDMDIRPYQSPYKIYIIPHADRMNEQAQNALLKTLEEPPAYGVIFLLAESAQALLPTIQSRCVMLKLRDLKDSLIEKYLTETLGIPRDKAAVCTAFAQGSLGRAIMLSQSDHFGEIRDHAVRLVKSVHDMEIYELIQAVKEIGEYKMDIADYLDFLTVWYRDVLMFKASGDANRVIFQDELASVREQAMRCSYEGLDEVIRSLQNAKDRIRANVNFDLVMELLLLTMKEN